MKLISRWALLLGVLLTIAACSDSGKVASSGPDVGSALVAMSSEDRRIGIVHSETSKQNFYDPFAYNQLFASGVIFKCTAIYAGVAVEVTLCSYFGPCRVNVECDNR